MACRTYGLFFVAITTVAVPALVLGTGACSKLTEPPKEDTIATADPAADSAAPDLKAKMAALASAAASASQLPSATPPPAASSAPAVPDEKPGINDTVVGKGAEAKTGDMVSVHYRGTLTDGKEFDSSKKHGKPFDFPLGGGQVIKCWDRGVVGMKVGGKRTLTCPPSIAYGARGFPPVIPPNSTLKFDVELLEIKAK